MSTQNFFLYSGDGSTITNRGLKLQPYEKSKLSDDPALYFAEKGLRDAVNVALALGQPLLVTGEPGTGKTQLGGSIAYELGLPPPLVFHTKTTSTAKDLFYRYDALRHFHDSQFRKEELSIERYIEYEALGLAILLSTKRDNEFLPKDLVHSELVRSVVLIDEVDKAPRDLPNDILNEIENMSFKVAETGAEFKADHAYRPILILTSNSEKNLPHAFLRRCVYYHISFPERDRLREIARRRLALQSDFIGEMLDNAIQRFEAIRELALKKKPATAEFLAWLHILNSMKLDVEKVRADQTGYLALSHSILAKSKEDQEILHKTFIKA